MVEISNVDGARELGPLPTRIREFHTHDIGKFMNISLIEFLNLPHHIVEHIIDLSVFERLAEENDRKNSKRKTRKDVAQELADLDL